MHVHLYILLCTGHLDQWDIVSLTLSHSLDCQGGPVWCTVANPTLPHQFAVGTEDGMVCFDVLVVVGGRLM